MKLQQVNPAFMKALESREGVISAALGLLGNAQYWIENPAELLERQARQLRGERFSRGKETRHGLPKL